MRLKQLCITKCEFLKLSLSDLQVETGVAMGISQGNELEFLKLSLSELQVETGVAMAISLCNGT